MLREERRRQSDVMKWQITVALFLKGLQLNKRKQQTNPFSILLSIRPNTLPNGQMNNWCDFGGDQHVRWLIRPHHVTTIVIRRQTTWSFQAGRVGGACLALVKVWSSHWSDVWLVCYQNKTKTTGWISPKRGGTTGPRLEICASLSAFYFPSAAQSLWWLK